MTREQEAKLIETIETAIRRRREAREAREVLDKLYQRKARLLRDDTLSPLERRFRLSQLQPTIEHFVSVIVAAV